MAAEGPNGVYSGYQGHDPATSASASQPATSTTPTAKPDALEIGWYFVEQYYTTLSKSPERIHLFYSKKSQLVTGKEAEKVVPCVGQKAISDKIKAIEYKDCKVRVLNVDSQASYQNIVVQVIGEISNNAQPHSKFVQTFVLAEQPNGYFVLNDIFRYIDLGDEEVVEEEPAVPADVAEEAEAVPEAPLPTKESHESVADEAAAKELDQKLEEITHDEEKAEPAVETNGLRNDEEVEKPVEIAAEPEVAPAVPSPAVEAPPEPEHSRAPSPPKEAVPVPSADAAPVKKTWASLVGAKAPATSIVPTQPTAAQSGGPKSSAAATPAPVAASAPASSETAAQSANAQGNGWQTADHGKKQKTQQKADQVVLAYVKGVTEKVDARVLRSTLEKYGELKYFDVSRPKNCAFVEFATTEGYNAAAAANPHVINGENILVEERRPRAGQFGNAGTGAYGRGGSNANRGRGGFQGRTGSQSGNVPKDAGRNNFQNRASNKGGNVTPKTRGQAQAA